MFGSILQYLKQLYIEQTSPTETIAFIFVAVAFCMVTAALVYVAVMSLIWAGQLRFRKVRFRRVFLPSAEQFGEYAGEYFLALATAIILSLTLTAKHATVEHIKTALNNAKLNSAADCEKFDVAHVFPLHVCPQRLAGISVLNLLQLADDHGQSDQAKFILESAYRKEQDDGRLPTAGITEGRILAACGFLIVCYLLWLSRKRFRYLVEDPEGKSEFDYAETARALLALSVCVALLLVAPTMLPNARTVGESALASVKALDPPPEIQTQEIEAVFENQRHNLGLLDDIPKGSDEPIFTLIKRIDRKVRDIEDKLRAGSDTEAQLQALQARHQQDIARLEAALNTNRDQQKVLADQFNVLSKEIRGRGGLLNEIRGRGGLRDVIRGRGGLLERVANLEKQVSACCQAGIPRGGGRAVPNQTPIP